MTINATIIAMITAISQAIVALFSFLLSVYNEKHDKRQIQNDSIKKNESKLEDVCDTGTLNELIDATKDLGKSKK